MKQQIERYYQQTRLLQVHVGVWEEHEVVIAGETGLGYWMPEGEQSYMLQHLASGRSLSVWALSEDAAQQCIEAVKGLVDWTLPKEQLFEVYDQEELHARFFSEVERLINGGWAILF